MATNILMIAGIIIVIGVIIVAALALSGSGGTKTTIATTTLSPTTVSPTTASPTTVSPTTVSATTVQATTTISGGGQYLLTQDQFSALVGPGGTYNIPTYTNYTSAYAQYSNGTSIFTNNVTGAWTVWYNTTSSNSSALEIVIQSPNSAKALYTYWIKHLSSSTYNVTNATTSGLTYSYYGLQNPYYSTSYMVGYKDNYLVLFISLKNYVSQTQLASTIAGDLP